MPLKIDAAVCSNMGKVRKNNEDNFYFDGLYMDENTRNQGGFYHQTNENELQIYAVCDGMGGEEGGEDASITAVRGLQKYAASEAHPDENQPLRDALQSISDTIDQNARTKGFHSGTTIAMMLFNGNTARVVHVGDSRVYGMQNKQLRRLTVDHSEVQRMFAMGLIKEEELDTHPRRHVISQYLGMPREDALVSPTLSEREEVTAETRYVICSDGLTDMVKDPELSQILAAAPNSEEAAKQLVLAALRNGGRDNVTVICLFVKPQKTGSTRHEGKKHESKSRKRRRRLAIAGMILSGGIFLAALILFLIDHVFL
ncbi:MAG: serine/threonine-protein phosphatase [Clostridia bacterium]|nr:serine/threonine-protein phosphatase [Clostridia bacterium]MBR6184627.1 serine/threonine-protein phosphatase [Clostridia bacterium]